MALTGVRRATLTLACDYAASAQVPLRISVATSPDGLGYDTEDRVWQGDLRRGAHAQKSFDLPLAGRFLRVILENPDRQAECGNIRVAGDVARRLTANATSREFSPGTCAGRRARHKCRG